MVQQIVAFYERGKKWDIFTALFTGPNSAKIELLKGAKKFKPIKQVKT